MHAAGIVTIIIQARLAIAVAADAMRGCKPAIMHPMCNLCMCMHSNQRYTEQDVIGSLNTEQPHTKLANRASCTQLCYLALQRQSFQDKPE